jgi:acyl-CoA thioester hydrolase
MTGTVLIRHRLRVRFRDCDPLGHVNNAVYLTYLEDARLTLWQGQLGGVARTDEQGRRGEGFILARAEVDFRAQVRFGAELEVRLALAAFGRTSATYDYEIVDLKSNMTVATAKTVQVWFDYDTQKPVPLSEETKRKLSEPV